MYRAFLRLAKRYDAHPHLKALLCLEQKLDYDELDAEWVDIETDHLRGFDDLAHRFLRGPRYRPSDDSSMLDYVRAEFRRPLPLPELEGARLDVGLASLAQLSSALGEALRLPLDEVQSAAGDDQTAAPAPPPRLTVMKGLQEVAPTAPHAQPAQLLFAHPTNVSPAFGRSVILVTTHHASGLHGVPSSIGYILNKESECTLKDAALIMPVGRSLAYFCAGGALRNNYIHVGGPVPTSLYCMYAADHLGSPADGSVKGDREREALLGGSLRMERVDVSFLRAVEEAIDVGRATPSDFKLMLGCAAWGAAKLEGEWSLAHWYGGTVEDERLVEEIAMRQQLRPDDGYDPRPPLPSTGDELASEDEDAQGFELDYDEADQGFLELDYDEESENPNDYDEEDIATAKKGEPEASELYDGDESSDEFSEGTLETELASMKQNTRTIKELLAAVNHDIGVFEVNLGQIKKAEGTVSQLNQKEAAEMRASNVGALCRNVKQLHWLLEDREPAQIGSHGRREWARLVGALRGEYRSIAQVSCAMGKQRELYSSRDPGAESLEPTGHIVGLFLPDSDD